MVIGSSVKLILDEANQSKAKQGTLASFKQHVSSVDRNLLSTSLERQGAVCITGLVCVSQNIYLFSL